MVLSCVPCFRAIGVRAEPVKREREFQMNIFYIIGVIVVVIVVLSLLGLT